MTIEYWMDSIVKDGGIERFDDLHIDRIDSKWRARELWLDGGLLAFKAAVSLRDHKQLPFSVVLAFGLQSYPQPRGIDFRSRAEFAQSLNRWTPPSIYLFKPGDEFWNQKTGADNISVQQLDSRLLGSEETKQAYYMEFKPFEADEYTRSVFFAG